MIRNRIGVMKNDVSIVHKFRSTNTYRLDILTKFGVNLFCILSVVGMIGHEIFDYLKRGDGKR